MLKHHLRYPSAGARLLACVAMLWASTPHSAENAVPEMTVPTPFKHYQGWRDTPLQNWREANERVGEIGGWRTYLREAQSGEEGASGNPGHHGNHHEH